MPKTAKKSAHESQNLPPEDTDVPESHEKSTSSDQEPDAEISLHPSLVPPAHPVCHVITNMYMSYIEAQNGLDC